MDSVAKSSSDVSGFVPWVKAHPKTTVAVTTVALGAIAIGIAFLAKPALAIAFAAFFSTPIGLPLAICLTLFALITLLALAVLHIKSLGLELPTITLKEIANRCFGKRDPTLTNSLFYPRLIDTRSKELIAAEAAAHALNNPRFYNFVLANTYEDFILPPSLPKNARLSQETYNLSAQSASMNPYDKIAKLHEAYEGLSGIKKFLIPSKWPTKDPDYRKNCLYYISELCNIDDLLLDDYSLLTSKSQDFRDFFRDNGNDIAKTSEILKA